MQRIDERAQVLLQLVGFERSAADGGMHDTGLIGTVLHLTRLGVLHRSGDVHGHGADLGVRHQTTGAEDLAESAHDTHGVGSGDDHIEVQVAGLDLFGQVVEADDFGASSLGGFGLFALGEDGDAHGLTGTGRQHHRATDHLVGLAGINAEIHGDVDRLVELGRCGFLDQRQSLTEGVSLVPIDLARQGLLLLGQLSHVRDPPP
ncbi:hypothetical protein SDC9_168048 [bioreactor metagenome]|uniref:NAD-specific glutamate dehydrogenase n=1 Tax=bioreactor metagenome TaxID=1076179 RepID=A0A645G4E3_9ZZZZ